MNTYKMMVCLEVSVDAFNEADAVEMVDEEFGEGSLGVITIDKLSITNISES